MCSVQSIFLSGIDLHSARSGGQVFIILFSFLQQLNRNVQFPHRVAEFTALNAAALFQLPFLSGEKWSIQNDKKYKEGQSRWLHRGVQSETIWTDSQLLSQPEFRLLCIEYFKGLHAEKEAIRISLPSEQRSLTEVWSNQPVTQENESPLVSFGSHGSLGFPTGVDM